MTESIPLTPRQREYLRMIWRFLHQHGRYPTYPEFAALMGFSHPTNAVKVALTALAAKGYVEWLPGPRERWALAGVRLVPTLDEGEAAARLREVVG